MSPDFAFFLVLVLESIPWFRFDSGNVFAVVSLVLKTLQKFSELDLELQRLALLEESVSVSFRGGGA